MNSKDLAQKILFGGRFAGEADQHAAKSVFLGHLLHRLGVEPNKVAGEDLLSNIYLMLDWLRDRGQEIHDDTIKEAHCRLLYPWARAIISNCLGYTNVTTLGVPPHYGV